jgi:hypothetical protein
VVPAANYDNGGEGIAFHTTRPLATPPVYRSDDLGLVPTTEAGGGYALPELGAGEWVRYSIDAGNGGYFDLTVRAASPHGGARARFVALDQTIATLDLPAAGTAFGDWHFPAVYLNPGEVSLLLFVDRGDLALASFSLTPAAAKPATYPAPLAFRRGVVGIAGVGRDGRALGYVQNLGRQGSSLLFGIDGGPGGPRVLRLHYANGKTVPVALTLKVGDQPPVKLPMAPTADAWRDLDVPVNLAPGGNRILLEGQEDGWNSVQLDWVEIVTK